MGKLEKAIYFMCQNFSSKVDWVNRLEEVIKSSPANLAPIKTESSVTRAVVASLPPPEEVNTSEYLRKQMAFYQKFTTISSILKTRKSPCAFFRQQDFIF